MKYPQLVSIRAVNAISDWLVSRIERLGIDAPLVYARLLLSLLHTPLQLNALDLAEVITEQSKLKGNLNRKNSRRLTSSETENLKRFAAIESLMDAASSDQNKTEIEDLVDELCEKLKDFEKQNSVEISEIKFVKSSRNNYNNNRPGESTSSDSPVEDPTKRYYRAFPPLSKNLDNQLNGKEKLKQMQMPLMWPAKKSYSTAVENPNENLQNKNGFNSGNSNNHNNNTNLSGVKRKTKRRRHNSNQGSLKSYRDNPFKRENSTFDKSNLWDTNFEGSWEMGRDLIREFVLKQNKRNRSISENDAVFQNKSNSSDFHHEPEDDNEFNKSINDNPDVIISETPTKVEEEKCEFPNIHMDEGFATPDTFASFCELSDIASSSKNQDFLNVRRLYEREPSNELIADDDNNNIALFEAKFNSSVEALWDDSASKNSNENNSDLNMFWSSYYKHHYKPENQYPTEKLLTKDSSTDTLSTSQQNLNKNMFIESGTNLQSSIWSNNMMDNLNNDNKSMSRNLWNDMISYYKDKDFTSTASVNNYSMDNSVNFARWSECSQEAPFIPQQNSFNKINESGNNNQTYKSLPIMYSTNNFNVSRKTDQVNANANNNNNNNNNAINTTATTSFDVKFDHFLNDKIKSFEKKIPVKVTLPNHSENSGFSRVYPKSQNMIDEYDRQYKNFLESNKQYRRICQENSLNDDENLLISESTHFKPIKQTYVDGHTFDIPSNLDDVKYRRSESGSLYHDTDKYMIYKYQDCIFGNYKRRNYNEEFLLKFCVKQNDKCCQTEYDLIDFNDNLNNNPLFYPNHNDVCIENFDNNNKCCNTLEDIVELKCQREKLNYCSCCKQQQQEQDHENQLIDYNSDDDDIILINQHYEIQKINNLNDGLNSELEDWTLNKSQSKCVNHSHTLWSHCTTCNYDIDSKPANRLMKAELSADGDEIMSDLKYMQNLFIGASWGENEDDDDDDDIDEDDDDDERDIIEDSDEELESEEIFQSNYANELNAKSNNDDVINDENYYNVSKLITDLLKPETAKSISQILGASQSQSILQEITISEKSQNYVQRNTDSECDDLCNNNNIYIAGDGVFGLWKKYDSGDWENSKNLKYIIENENILENDDEDEDDDDEDNNSHKQNDHYEIITVWNDDSHFSEFMIHDNRDCNYFDKTNWINYKIHNNRSFDNKTMVNKRFDRKRRHSSSQNFNDSLAHSKYLQNQIDNCDVKATVITCKYWTKNSKILPNIERDLTVQPSSILKHVAMVSRPLTR